MRTADRAGSGLVSCSVELHKQLGALYVNDPRFTASLDKIAPGYARYLSEAISASRERPGP